MHLQDYYMGENAPFEGNLSLWLRSLPVGARATKATITLKRAAYSGIIDFSTSNAPILGVTKVPENTSGTFVEVDFHARRTLVSIAGSGGKADLQVDMGGTYVGIASDGTFLAPGKDPFVLDLSTPADIPVPGLTVSKFRLSQDKGNTSNLNVNRVSISSFPTNVNVRLGQLPAFLTLTGEVAAETTSSDFAPVLNAFLATAQSQNGFYAIPFVIHSDTIAALDLTVEIDYVIDQSALPSHLPEINLPYTFNQLPDISVNPTMITLPEGAIPVTGASSAKINGQFQPTRLALDRGGSVDQPAIANVLVSPECSLAQPLQSDTEIEVTGIDLPLFNTQPGLTGLNIAIREDDDGKPSSTVGVSAAVTVGKPLPDQSVWGSAVLPKSFRVLSTDSQGRKIRYWLVLQSQVGQAYWRATPGASGNGNPPLQCSRDNGLSWRAASSDQVLAPLSAQFRLRDTPARFSIPVQLQIGTGASAARRRLDEFALLGRVDLSFDFSGKLGEYLTGTAAKTASPCGNQNLVINGDFADPPPDDANVRLFGVESKMSETISSVSLPGRGVDLSVERFITLSSTIAITENPPVRIDCAGSVPARTTVDEIVRAINGKISQFVTATKKVNGDSFFLQAQGSSVEAILFPWCSNLVPTGWQSTASQIYRFRLKMADGTSRVVALLTNLASLGQLFSVLPSFESAVPGCLLPGTSSSGASSSGEISLSQRLPVATGCAYHLSISYQIRPFDPKAQIGLSNQSSTQTLTEWEVAWLDTNGSALRTDSETLESLFGDEVTRTLSASSSVDTLLVAPPNAVTADLRFINSSPDVYALFLETVSFTPTLGSVRNGHFLQWQGGPGNELPAGWTLQSGSVTSDFRDMQPILQGDGADDTVLAQKVDVVAGVYYALQVRARPLFPKTSDTKQPPIQQHAKLELQWLSSTSSGDTVSLFLDGQTFIEGDWAGTAPDGVTQAEIRLIQPKNSNQVNLQVASVALTHINRIPVPLTFLSETPGQLTVSNMHVVYDVPETLGPKRRATPTTTNVQKKGAIPQPPTVPGGTNGAMLAITQPAVSPMAATTASGEETAPSTPSIENTRIRMLLKTIARESSTLRLLRDDPQRIQQKFGLSDEELSALRSADLLRAGELQMQRGNGGILVPGGQAVEVPEVGGTGTIVPPSFISGLDVSHYDGVIDWSAVPSQEYAFAFAKATEGTGHTDSQFARNWAGIKQNNILRGAYHFFRPGMDPMKQADHFLKIVPSLQAADLPPVLDLESTDKMSGTAVLDAAEQWLTHVEQALGRTPIIYSSARFWREDLANANNPNRFSAHYPVWVAYYRPATEPPLPDGWTRWTFWQYTDKGMVNGVPGSHGHVDLNRFNGSLADLRVLAGL